MIPLPACRTVLGEYAAYQLAHVGHRVTGQAEAVALVTPYDHAHRPTYLTFRRDPGKAWQALAGERAVLTDAIHAAGSETRIVGMGSDELAALLTMAEAAR
ncbi:hypothetical protein [Streptosporangium carneum]|uniref:Uncharacterized protein n=1 Tax=Streptosporangium carneum TaxID=47481 RepID=A0A9W6HVT0_9ACTN|nr:hypothetical protein [Streptosporangium carneum]GLK07261.1 hypothetical protein GCM10017600_06660 [Streptosporangium carneum]